MAGQLKATRYRENPFIKDGLVKTRTKRVVVSSKRQAILDTETGEVTAAAEIVSTRQVDSESFIKLYTASVDAMFDLTPMTLKLFRVLLIQVQLAPNSDRVMLTHGTAAAYFEDRGEKPPSRPSFHRAVAEMVQKNFVAATEFPGMYFFNPAMFFNGDRVRFVTELVRKRTTSGKQSGGSLISDDRQIDLEDALDFLSDKE